MKRKNMSRPVRLMISCGSLMTSSAAFIHVEFAHIPDFVLGLTEGAGIGLMIAGLIKFKRGKSACYRDNESEAYQDKF